MRWSRRLLIRSMDKVKKVKLKCESCDGAKKGEALWKYDGRWVCAYCFLDILLNGMVTPDDIGWVGDERDEL